MNNTSYKIGELQNINTKKDEIIKALEQQLQKEKTEVDSMKIEIDKIGREKHSLHERFDTMVQDKTAAGKSSLQDDNLESIQTPILGSLTSLKLVNTVVGTHKFLSIESISF